ncbi:energy transducer TonB [Pleionea sp. CnH1-48]|uniref:energy transducer TonB n=1 Tax=Pleionea sp. CnH1-48 TaxID=2954494 RepID=UPI0020982BB6|nr:energy transducer TonB [Pleionea sp. CnH1-48]MCO7225438.1 TonB family protein [Pleionea sp. CnH1-48]
MPRILIGLLLGAGITFSLFIFMAVLIDTADGDFKRKEYQTVDYNMTEPEEKSRRKQRKVPKKPEPPKEPPPPETQKVSKVTNPTVQNVNIQLSKLDVSVGGDGPFIGNMAQMMTQDGDAIPLNIIQPPYPRKAAMEGIEGWVKLKFTIKPDGFPEDVKVIESKPRRIFDKAARRVIYKWRFKPKVVNGKAVHQHNMFYTMDFTLTD